MHIAYTRFFYGATQQGFIVRKLHPMECQHITGSAYATAASVSVLADQVPCTSNDKGCAGTDIEGVLAITAGTHYIQCVEVVQMYTLACLEQTFPETNHFIHCDSTNLQGCEQSRNLHGCVGFPCDIDHDVVSLIAGQ